MSSPDDAPATPPAHVLFWDGDEWSCNCEATWLTTDGQARSHYDVHFPAGSREQ